MGKEIRIPNLLVNRKLLFVRLLVGRAPKVLRLLKLVRLSLLMTEQRTVDSVQLLVAEESIVKACVLIRVRPGHHYSIAEKIAAFEGVKSAFAVVGNADVVARIEVRNMRALAALGTRIGDLAGVVITETLVTAEA